MRARWVSARGLLRPALVMAVLAGLAATSERAAAEAPFFYDDLSVAASYDNEFDPALRPGRTLTLLAQAWSQPEAGNPHQSVIEQRYTQQYRGIWNFTLDEKSNLLVDLKGASKGMVIPDDYFLKAEYLFKGAHAPLWAYTGIRVPHETDFLLYAGVETMSRRMSDFFSNTSWDPPVAFKGYAELRHDEDWDDPQLRLMLLAHTIPAWAVDGLTLAAGLDTYFQPNVEPRWMAQGHADYAVTHGFGAISLVTGYAIDLEKAGEQRLSVGVSIGLF